MRLGIVPYLNSFPLVYGLDLPLYQAPPSIIVKEAADEDIILAPIVAAFIDPGWYLLDGVGIGSFGPVETVKLFLKDEHITIENLKSIYLDQESLTSVALLKILVGKYYRRETNSIAFKDQRDGCDACLFIGDKIWKISDSPSIDLGTSWTQWTSLPFVYACWMTRSQEVGRKWKKVLLTQAQKNLENLPSLVSKAPQNNCPDVLRYWRQLNYLLEPKHKEGIQRFQKEWASPENRPVFDLKWI